MNNSGKFVCSGYIKLALDDSETFFKVITVVKVIIVIKVIIVTNVIDKGMYSL